jgi:hypothetical protein
MKLSAAVGVGLLSLLLGVPAAVYAQDEPKQEEAKPEPKPDKDEAKPPKQDNVKPPKEEDSTHSSKTSTQAEKSQTEQSQNAKPAGKGGHIPDNQFKAHFGRSHTFVVNQTVVVQGQPRFQYGGYWFSLSDTWPAGWAYTDQCYIDYIDGEYVLYDLLHPGVTVVLVVVM